MGSGISAPNTKDAELETHEDLMEIRFDHLAFGGTAMIILALCAAAYCVCKSRKRHKAQQTQHQGPWYPGPIIMPTPSPYVPWMNPMNNFNHPMNNFNPMEIVFDPRQQAAMFMPQRPPPYEGRIAERQDNRFTELAVNNTVTATPPNAVAQGQRPDRPRLPSPQRSRMINNTRAIPGQAD